MSNYLRSGTVLRTSAGFSPCRFCGKPHGAIEYTDGVLVWPQGLSHEIDDHAVRLPKPVEDYVLSTSDRLEATPVSLEWWTAGAPPLSADGPLEPLQRIIWRGNAQLVQQPGRRFPGLFVQGDTLANQVDGPRSRELVRWYEDMMNAAGLDELPYQTGPTH